MVHAEDGGNDVDGYGDAERLHQVERSCRIDPIEGLLDDPLHLGAKSRDAGIEGPGQWLADARVVGVIEREDARGFAAGHVVGDGFEAAAQPRGRLGVDGVAPEAAIRDQSADVVIAREDETARRLVAVDRALRAQRVEGHVRICPIVGIQRRQLQKCRRRI